MQRTKIHDMVSADGAIVDYDIWQKDNVTKASKSR